MTDSPQETLAPPGLAKDQLLTDVLKRVSRSFYLTLNILPPPVRTQVGLAYLFARAADTIADTDLIGQDLRRQCLSQFKAQFDGRGGCSKEIQEIQGAVLPHQSQSAERLLLERVDGCFRVYGELSGEDQERISSLMQRLIPGMEMDLAVFAEGSRDHPVPLPSMEDLDRYIYHVAGCVGEFWTQMMCAHLPSLAAWNVPEMSKVGVRFGKGLQLTNVVKDLARDLQRGRCYIPEPFLHEAGLRPRDLLQKESLRSLRPVLDRLIHVALDHLDQGWLYTLAIPRRETRLRLACMWPILFAGQTLRRVAISSDLLDPSVNVKMPKGQVYRLMAGTILTGACGYLWTAYWGHLRKQIA